VDLFVLKVGVPSFLWLLMCKLPIRFTVKKAPAKKLGASFLQ
jgi:hypothetical protein